jgi:hypothetical protein
MKWRTFSNAFGEELWHAIELALDAIQAASDTDRIVEDGVLGVVQIRLLAGLKLVEAENIIDDLFFLAGRLAGGLPACVRLGDARHIERRGRGNTKFNGLDSVVVGAWETTIEENQCSRQTSSKTWASGGLPRSTRFSNDDEMLRTRPVTDTCHKRMHIEKS